MLKIENYNKRLKNSLKKKIEFMRLRYEKCMASKIFTDATSKIKEQYINLDLKIKSIENSIKLKVKDLKTKEIKLISKLDTLSPLKTLSRGFCIAEMDNRTIKNASELKADDIISLKFTDGQKKTKVI